MSYNMGYGNNGGNDVMNAIAYSGVACCVCSENQDYRVEAGTRI